MGEVLWGAEEKDGYRRIQSRRTADVITVHNHIYRHCPQCQFRAWEQPQGWRGPSPAMVSMQQHTCHPFSLLFLSGPPSSWVGMAVEGTQPQKPVQCSPAPECNPEVPTPVLRNKGQPHQQHCPHKLPPLAIQQGH